MISTISLWIPMQGEGHAEAGRSENKSTLRNRKAFLESGTLLFSSTNNNKNGYGCWGCVPTKPEPPINARPAISARSRNPSALNAFWRKGKTSLTTVKTFHNQTTGELQCNYNPAQREHTTHNKQYRWHSSQHHDRVQWHSFHFLFDF